MTINDEMWASARESTIRGNISGTWHGCSRVTQSYCSSPCIFHIPLPFQCLYPKAVCAHLRLFSDTSPSIQPSVFYPLYQLHLFAVATMRDIWPLINEEIQYINNSNRLNANELTSYYIKRYKYTIEFSNTCFPFMCRHGSCPIYINLKREENSSVVTLTKFLSLIRTSKTQNALDHTLYIRILNNPRAPARLQSVHCTKKRNRCAAILYDILIWRHAPSYSLGKSDALHTQLRIKW